MLMLFTASLMSVQPRHAKAQEPTVEAVEAVEPSGAAAEPAVEVVTQNGTVSTEMEDEAGGLDLLSRFPFRLSLTILGGYDDNVNTSGERQGSSFANGRGTLSYALEKPDTKLTAVAGAGVVYFPDRTNGRTYDVNTKLNLSLKQKISLRLSLSANVSASYQVEPDFSSDVGLDTRRGQYFNMNSRVAAAYEWSSRFSTVTSYTFRPVKYDNSSSGALQDRMQHTFGEELRFTLVPGTTLTGQYRYAITDYDSAPLDSTTQIVLAGVDHSFSPRLDLNVSGGTSFRSLDNDGSKTSPHGEGSLNFSLAPGASLSWTARYGFEEPNSTGALSRQTFRTGLRLNYNLTRRINATFAGDYRHDENEGLNSPGKVSSAVSRDAFDLSLNVRYAIHRNLGLILNYRHSEVASSPSDLNYSRTRYSAGLNFTY